MQLFILALAVCITVAASEWPSYYNQPWRNEYTPYKSPESETHSYNSNPFHFWYHPYSTRVYPTIYSRHWSQPYQKSWYQSENSWQPSNSFYPGRPYQTYTPYQPRENRWNWNYNNWQSQSYNQPEYRNEEYLYSRENQPQSWIPYNSFAARSLPSQSYSPRVFYRSNPEWTRRSWDLKPYVSFITKPIQGLIKPFQSKPSKPSFPIKPFNGFQISSPFKKSETNEEQYVPKSYPSRLYRPNPPHAFEWVPLESTPVSSHPLENKPESNPFSNKKQPHIYAPVSKRTYPLIRYHPAPLKPENSSPIKPYHPFTAIHPSPNKPYHPYPIHHPSPVKPYHSYPIHHSRPLVPYYIPIHYTASPKPPAIKKQPSKNEVSFPDLDKLLSFLQKPTKPVTKPESSTSKPFHMFFFKPLLPFLDTLKELPFVPDNSKIIEINHVPLKHPIVIKKSEHQEKPKQKEPWHPTSTTISQEKPAKLEVNTAKPEDIKKSEEKKPEQQKERKEEHSSIKPFQAKSEAKTESWYPFVNSWKPYKELSEKEHKSVKENEVK